MDSITAIALILIGIALISLAFKAGRQVTLNKYVYEQLITISGAINNLTRDLRNAETLTQLNQNECTDLFTQIATANSLIHSLGHFNIAGGKVESSLVHTVKTIKTYIDDITNLNRAADQELERIEKVLIELCKTVIKVKPSRVKVKK